MRITLPPARSNSSGTGFAMTPTTPTTPGATSAKEKKGKFRRSWSYTASSSSGVPTPATPGGELGNEPVGGNGKENGKGKKGKKDGKKKDGKGKGEFNFSPENDILGIVMLEIQGATDLPRLKNSTCPSFPFLFCPAGLCFIIVYLELALTWLLLQ